MDAMPKTLTEAIRYYSSEQVCIDAVASLRWAVPNGSFPRAAARTVCTGSRTTQDDRADAPTVCAWNALLTI